MTNSLINTVRDWIYCGLEKLHCKFSAFSLATNEWGRNSKPTIFKPAKHNLTAHSPVSKRVVTASHHDT